MIHFGSRSYDYTMYNQLLWEAAERGVIIIIITLAELGRKDESCNLTICEQSKFETYTYYTTSRSMESWSVVSDSN